MVDREIISIGSDHAGFDYKEMIKAWLMRNNYRVMDHGTFDKDSTDYPDYVHPLANSIEDGTARLGVLICGSANGVAMTANKHQGVRAAICWNNELAALSRQHNNANVICFAERFMEKELVLAMLETFLKTEFEGGRHQRRVEKIALNISLETVK